MHMSKSGGAGVQRHCIAVIPMEIESSDAPVHAPAARARLASRGEDDGTRIPVRALARRAPGA